MGIPLKYKVSVWQNRSTNNEIKKKQYRKLLLFIIITGFMIDILCFIPINKKMIKEDCVNR
ncbi:hypothetical protein DW198_04590 [Bacteroides fragilis]|nr:hypothetical protein DW198_04590 [Bacteroides fragilis]